MRTHVALLAWLTMSGCTDAPESTEQGPEATTGTLERGAALDGGLTALSPSTLNIPEIPAVEPEAPAATEKGLPDDVQAISFQSLSLLDADVDGLLDLIFNPIGEEGAEANTDFVFPESTQSLDGERVAIVGYMIPLDWVPGEDRITSFMLVRDFAQCCFGGMPRPDEWIDVITPLGESAGFYAYRPVRVIGKMRVGLDRPADAMVASVYQMVATDVTDTW
jgi:hypothetical protein